ncbi:hypothetical protein AB0K27_06185 [Micromonospora echinospora]
MVTPEYNHSFPASLKQASDVAYDELRWWGRALREGRSARPYAC